MNPQRIKGIEAAQLRALTDHFTEADVDPEAAIALALTDGVLQVQIDHPGDDATRTTLAIGVDAEVLPRIGPAAPAEVDFDDPDSDPVDAAAQLRDRC